MPGCDVMTVLGGAAASEQRTACWMSSSDVMWFLVGLLRCVDGACSFAWEYGCSGLVLHAQLQPAQEKQIHPRPRRPSHSCPPSPAHRTKRPCTLVNRWPRNTSLARSRATNVTRAALALWLWLSCCPVVSLHKRRHSPVNVVDSLMRPPTVTRRSPHTHSPRANRRLCIAHHHPIV